jgi:signal transduction histidine kinase
MGRLLLVDDDTSNRSMMQSLLGRDYTIVSVRSGQEALERLNQDEFDLVLLDVMMPGMNGFEVLEVIRSAPRLAELPVILISGRTDTGLVVQGLELGANDYLSKPVNLKVAKARINTQISLKRLADERRRAMEEFKAVQDMKDRLIQVASHDLKAPLSNLRTAQYLLREILNDSPDARAILDNIGVTLDGMQTIIEDFLESAALPSRPLDLRLDCVLVADVLREVVEQFFFPASAKRINLKLGISDGMVLADVRRLNQIIANLVSNAVKYSPPETLVTVWTEVARQTTSAADGTYMSPVVRICVGDQGPGIPSNERDLLFEPFSKLSTRPTGGESSTGLGLWIVKHLATLQNGEVGVECPPEGGSIFWVSLPEYGVPVGD